MIGSKKISQNIEDICFFINGGQNENMSGLKDKRRRFKEALDSGMMSLELSVFIDKILMLSEDA